MSLSKVYNEWQKNIWNNNQACIVKHKASKFKSSPVGCSDSGKRMLNIILKVHSWKIHEGWKLSRHWKWVRKYSVAHSKTYWHSYELNFVLLDEIWWLTLNYGGSFSFWWKSRDLETFYINIRKRYSRLRHRKCFEYQK